MRGMRAITWAMISVATLVAADTPEKSSPQVKKPNLWAALSVSQPLFDWSVMKPQDFRVFFSLVNDGDKTVAPAIEKSRLIVNGKELADWDGVSVRGPRADTWDSLPPKDYILFWRNLVKHFREPGLYRVAWKGEHFESPEVVFRVLPGKKK